MNKPEYKAFVVLLFCLFLGIALRLYTFDQKSLWLDEVYTYNDSRIGFTEQINFYKEKPTYSHLPLFFFLTHFFYPFPHPERDLRIIPLIFGILSIPMVYLLARQFSKSIALPCTLGLTFMAYHISLSQEGRFYSMLMFFGTAGLFFFMKYLKDSKRPYLFFAALCFTVMFYTSYSSIPFIVSSQLLWFYRLEGKDKNPCLRPFLSLNGFLLLFCLPWIFFVALNYKGQPFITESFRTQDIGSLWDTLYGVLHDWAPHSPLIIVSAILLTLFPIFSADRRNAIILLAIIILPVMGLHFYCKLNNITHFITSRYFISFLPIFLITIFLSLDVIPKKFKSSKRFFRLELLFTVLLIASNLIILPFYYRSEKQDFRGLANYLKGHIQDGDRIIVGSYGYVPGLLYYFGIIPKDRFYMMSTRRVSDNEVEYVAFLTTEGKRFIISYSNTYWIKYAEQGNRLWIVVDKETALKLKDLPQCVPKGYFDGSFLNFNRFPTDASMYLFLFDPKSPGEKGIGIPIE